MRVRDLMTPDPWSCAPTDSLAAAARLLWDRDVGVLPVVEGGVVVGMLTDRDACMAAYTQGRPLAELPVRSAMSREVHAARPDDSIASAMFTMREQQVRRLPVVDEAGGLQGVLSVGDLTGAAVVGDLDPGELIDTLAAIGRSRSDLRPLQLVPVRVRHRSA